MRESAATAALIEGDPISRMAFVTAIHKQIPLLQQVDSAALFYRSTTEFAVVLLAALANNVRVILPQDDTPASVAQMKAAAGLVLTDDLQLALQHGIGHRSSHFAASENNGFLELPTIHDDAELVFFTSGSSGEPKAIHKTWYQLRQEVDCLVRLWGSELQSGGGIAASVSHQHIYGMLFRCLLPLQLGVPILDGLVEYPSDLLQRCAANRPAAFVSSPAWLQRLPAALDLEQVAGIVGPVFSSGGPLAGETAALFHRHNLPIREVYGSTETGGIAWRVRVQDGEQDWVLFDDTEIDIRGGRLAVCSPKTRDDWFQTEDLAVQTGTNSFALQGRADRTVKIAEKRISLAQIENALATHSDIQEAAVFLHQGTRPEIAAAVELTDAGVAALAQAGKAAWTRTLRQQLASSIVRVALPRRWRIVDALPRTAAGKVDRIAVENLFKDRSTQ